MDKTEVIELHRFKVSNNLKMWQTKNTLNGYTYFLGCSFSTVIFIFLNIYSLKPYSFSIVSISDYLKLNHLKQ